MIVLLSDNIPLTLSSSPIVRDLRSFLLLLLTYVNIAGTYFFHSRRNAVFTSFFFQPLNRSLVPARNTDKAGILHA